MPVIDHQAAHRRRSGLFEMGLRTIGADRLATSLPNAQRVDNARAKQENNQRRCDQRSAGSERDIAEHVQKLDMFRQPGEIVQHTLIPHTRRLFGRTERLYGVVFLQERFHDLREAGPLG